MDQHCVGESFFGRVEAGEEIVHFDGGSVEWAPYATHVIAYVFT